MTSKGCTKKGGSIYRYLSGYKKECIISPLFKFLESAMELLVPIVVSSIIDVGIANGDKAYILKATGVLLGFGFLGLVFAVIAQYYAAKAAMGFSKKLRSEMFRHVESFSPASFNRFGGSTLITRITADVNQVQRGVNLTLRLVLRSPFIVFGALIAAFIIDVPSASVFSIAIPLLAVVVFCIMYFGIPLFKKIQAKLDKVLSGVKNSLSGARVIRAFGRDDAEKADFDSQNDELFTEQIKAGRLTALLNPLTYVIVNVAIVVLLNIDAIRVDNGTLTQGEVVALYNYMSQILVELVKLANLIITLTKASAGAKRIQTILDASTGERGEETVPESGENILEFNDVGCRYPSASQEAVSGVSFKLKKGEILGVIGGTGSGKSTLINMIPRFLEKSDGEILYKGRNIEDLNVESLRGDIGLVPQKSVLFSGTVRENLTLKSDEISDEELWNALDIAQCAEVVRGKKGGLDYEIEQGGANLSGGQKQRLCIARAMVGSPSLLILDDSTSALDYMTESKLKNKLLELKEAPAIIIASQRASTVMKADKILVLDDGKVVGFGTHDELMRDCSVYIEIYQSQFK